MADFKKQQTKPLPSPAKSDCHVILHVAPFPFPHHHRPPPKRASKCFVYTFAAFVILCFLLLISALVFLRPKPLPLLLSSPSLLSLSSSSSQPPSFHASLSATLTINNPNFAPVHLRSASLSLLHLNQTVGSSYVVPKNVVLRWRSEEAVKVSVTALKTTSSDEELNSGVLGLKGVVRVTGEAVLFNRIGRPAVGGLECDISIDLRSKRLLSFLCA